MAYQPYKFTREEMDEGVRMLVEAYPRCFFANPRQRRPLKRNIVTDLQKDGFAMARDLITASVNRYRGHISYQYCLLAGAKRIDLNGNEVSTVTEYDELGAKKKIAAINRKFNEYVPPALPSFITQQSTPVKQRIDSAPMEKTNPVIRPELTRLYDAVLAANSAMGAIADKKDMFAAITTAAINVILREAQSVIINIGVDAK
jgi:sRNA-binding protein